MATKTPKTQPKPDQTLEQDAASFRASEMWKGTFWQECPDGTFIDPGANYMAVPNGNAVEIQFFGADGTTDHAGMPGGMYSILIDDIGKFSAMITELAGRFGDSKS